MGHVVFTFFVFFLVTIVAGMLFVGWAFSLLFKGIFWLVGGGKAGGAAKDAGAIAAMSAFAMQADESDGSAILPAVRAGAGEGRAGCCGETGGSRLEDVDMSSFNPTQWTMEPPDRPDHLAMAVMQSLSRPIHKSRPWSPLQTFVLAAVSFGALPLLVWPKRFGQYIVSEQQQFWHLVDWLRVRTGDPEAAQLKKSVRNTGPRLSIWLIPLCMLVWIGAQFFPFLSLNWFRLREMLLVTYAYPRHPGALVNLVSVPTPLRLFQTWTVCLSVAYAVHWLQIRQHALDVGKLVAKVNALLAKENVEPVVVPRVGLGMLPLWMLAGIIGAAAGAWWAIPAALAGALQATYIYRTGPWVRSQLGERVHRMLLSHRPPMNVPIPARFRVACPNPVCRAALPQGAVFCTRCGTRLAAAVNRLA